MPLPGSASGIIDFPAEHGISHKIGGAAVSDPASADMALDPDAEWLSATHRTVRGFTRAERKRPVDDWKLV